MIYKLNANKAMTYDEFLAIKEKQRKAHQIIQEVAELTETAKIIRGGDLVTTIITGGREYILPSSVEGIFIAALETRVEQLNEEFANL